MVETAPIENTTSIIVGERILYNVSLLNLLQDQTCATSKDSAQSDQSLR